LIGAMIRMIWKHSDRIPSRVVHLEEATSLCSGREDSLEAKASSGSSSREAGVDFSFLGDFHFRRRIGGVLRCWTLVHLPAFTVLGAIQRRSL
jgi:hypothetical protein